MIFVRFRYVSSGVGMLWHFLRAISIICLLFSVQHEFGGYCIAFQCLQLRSDAFFLCSCWLSGFSVFWPAHVRSGRVTSMDRWLAQNIRIALAIHNSRRHRSNQGRTCLSSVFCPLGFMALRTTHRKVGCRGGSRYVEGWWGSQDTDFPRCTRIIQDLKDSPNCFSKIHQNY